MLAGVIPIDLLIRERMLVKEDLQNGALKEICKRGHRQETIRLWQQRWASSIKGRETYTFFPDIRKRLKLKINTNHYATQYLTCLLYTSRCV